MAKNQQLEVWKSILRNDNLPRRQIFRIVGREMREFIDCNQITWPITAIRPLHENEAQGIEGNDLRNLLPPSFDAYVKIFDFLYDQSKEPPERVSWKLATEITGLAFTPELGFWSFSPPSTHLWNWPEDFLHLEVTARLLACA